MILRAIRYFGLVLLVSVPSGAFAQPAAPPATAAPPAPSSAAPTDKVMSAEELDALLAPIALYPDTLLALVLMASTYPLEVVEADRWVTENKALKGDELKAAAEQKSWDDSIKSLTATPPVL